MWTPLRLLTSILIAIETAVAVFYLIVFNQPGRSDAIANIVSDGVTAIVLGLWLIFVLPALVLSIRDKHPKLALAFALAAIPAAAVSFMLA
jgi:hypothetical protein